MTNNYQNFSVENFIEHVQNDISFLEQSRDTMLDIIKDSEKLSENEEIQKKLQRLNDSIDKYKFNFQEFLNKYDIS